VRPERDMRQDLFEPSTGPRINSATRLPSVMRPTHTHTAHLTPGAYLAVVRALDGSGRVSRESRTTFTVGSEAKVPYPATGIYPSSALVPGD
jgi:hypothetical protein